MEKQNQIRPNRTLPRNIKSLCPECGKIISAHIFEKGGKVLIEKKCAEHDTFSDVYWSDADMYAKAEEFAYDGKGVENPRVPVTDGCPFDCGLCDAHLTHTLLANMDLTNRCNLRCPICFANANAAGYVYEPDFKTIVGMMRVLRENKPVPVAAIQFSGGEPTIRADFIEILRTASRMGFRQVQVATNGLKMAEDPRFVQEMVNAGLKTAYLQFDGLDDEIYLKSRGRRLLKVKEKAIENCRKSAPSLSTVLVPTVVKTVNDGQVGPIFDFAVKNSDIIRGINYQPVAFTGRISLKERQRQRFTIPDLCIALEKHTGGAIKRSDFYPVPFVAPVSELVAAVEHKPQITFTTHPHCGMATYVFVEKKKSCQIAPKVIPITDFVDVEGFMSDVMHLAISARKSFSPRLNVWLNSGKILRNIDGKKAPAGLDLKSVIRSIVMNDYSSLRKFAWNSLLIGAMHFQDSYNYDIERVKRCGIHQITPDGRLIPFCAYNGGPTYRKEVE
ncbi:MAG: radical SAM protein, partial [Candidatus Thermoplasmatota archaeon]|nr:radical SAM protein [Candidatus Thermoplasmatota archaeon]